MMDVDDEYDFDNSSAWEHLIAPESNCTFVPGYLIDPEVSISTCAPPVLHFEGKSMDSFKAEPALQPVVQGDAVEDTSQSLSKMVSDDLDAFFDGVKDAYDTIPASEHIKGFDFFGCETFEDESELDDLSESKVFRSKIETFWIGMFWFSMMFWDLLANIVLPTRTFLKFEKMDTEEQRLLNETLDYKRRRKKF
jgi:hypothetical protein